MGGPTDVALRAPSINQRDECYASRVAISFTHNPAPLSAAASMSGLSPRSLGSVEAAKSLRALALRLALHDAGANDPRPGMTGQDSSYLADHHALSWEAGALS